MTEAELREAALHRAHWWCQYCLDSPADDVRRIVGDVWALWNVAAVCDTCSKTRRARM